MHMNEPSNVYYTTFGRASETFGTKQGMMVRTVIPDKLDVQIDIG
jgi:hypothetical protein